MIIGDHIGPLRIERPLGAGGMGEVFLARDERLERLVAVKLLPEGRQLDVDARGRMLREARAASALKHPNIVTVYDIGEHEGRAYIVMEYVEGETFDALIATRGALPPAEAVELLGQAADAVGAAHAAGVLHRDLKSANLMREANGRVKVLDFGLSKRTDGATAPPTLPGRTRAPGARAPTSEPDLGVAQTVVSTPTSPVSSGSRTDEPMTEHGARMGTPGWAPPELIDGLSADARSDVFALGCVLYHLLAGRPPFTGTAWGALRDQIEQGPPPPSKYAPQVPAALDRVVLTALAVDPASRPATPGALIAGAREALGTPRRGRTALFAVAAVVLGGGVVALALASGNRTSSPQGAVPPAADAAPTPEPSGPVTPTLLTKLGGCAYSPTFLDDHTVAFDLTRNGAVDLYELDLAGDGAAVQLTRDPGWEWRSSRGASAQELLFIRQDETRTALETLDLASGARTTLLESGGPIAYAGGAYFYSPANSGNLRRIDGGHDTVFAAAAPGLVIDTLVASPDGKRLAALLFGERALPVICTFDTATAAMVCSKARTTSARVAFSSRSDSLYYDSHGGIDRLRLADDSSERVLPDKNGIGGIAVAPSGGALVYSDCGAKTELFSLLEDPEHPISTEWPTLSHPAFGPDGQLAYVRGNARVEAILLRDGAGSVRELVARDQARFTDLAFSGDGQHLVYSVADANVPGIYVACTCTEPQPNRITEDATDDGPLFAGEQIVFTRRGKDGAPQLMRVGRDGSGLELASRRPRLTVDADPRHHRLLLASPAFDYLYWWDWTTGRETAGPRLPKIGVPVDSALSPDGRWLVMLAGISGQDVWRMRVDGKGKPERAFQLPQDQSALAVAIDDRGMPLVAVDRWAGELWLATAPAGAAW